MVNPMTDNKPKDDGDIEQHIIRKFDVQQKLGKGAYGTVWKVKDRKRGEVVALKKCFDAFRNSTDAQRTFREIMYLQEISGHENIIRLLSVIRADNDKDIYLTFDHMETDLHAVIKAGILLDVHKQWITYQMLKALIFIHSGDLLHRDIKPSNVLLNADCFAKLCDFGLCRSVHECQGGPNNPALTDYVATRWYRAPEILLGSHKYSKAVDMWAIGCVLGEMLTGRPLFPGTSTMNQIERILAVTGRPTQTDIAGTHSPFAATMLQSIVQPRRPRSVSEKIFPGAPPEAVDLVLQCLKFNPDNRISAFDAIKHPYVAQFHDPNAEPLATRPIQIVIDDNTKYTAADYRERLYREIKKKKKASRSRARESRK